MAAALCLLLIGTASAIEPNFEDFESALELPNGEVVDVSIEL